MNTVQMSAVPTISTVQDSVTRSPSEITVKRFSEVAATFESALTSSFPQQVEALAQAIGDAFENGRKLLVFGNGGSASDAQHLCGELVVRFQVTRRPLPAIALCCDAAVMTACGNDFSFNEVFARQVQALGVKGDVALGISTSGNSVNVLSALEAASDLGMTTALLTGPVRRSTAEFCDHVVTAPGSRTARIQELHLVAYHVLCELIESRFFGDIA